ncbi:MAG: hypothetical protein V1720_03490 [bacterium]
MVYESLIAIVESSLKDLVKSWVKEILRSDYMKTYHALTEVQILQRGETLFGNLKKWLDRGAYGEEVEEYFVKVGEDRFMEGFPLSEIHYALYLEKKVLWSYVNWKEDVTGKFTTPEAIEFMTVLNNYFDLGNFFIIKGYMQALYDRLVESDKFSDEELKNYIGKGALYEETVKKIREKMYAPKLNLKKE